MPRNSATPEAKDAFFRPEGAKKEEGGSRVGFSQTWKEKGPGGEVLFAYKPARPEIQVISGRQGEPSLMMRISPKAIAEASKLFTTRSIRSIGESP